MARRKRYGVKFPFNIRSVEKSLVDLDLNELDGVKSQLMHLIFTPVGQRLRKPLFGSRLIQFIFNPNDGETWGDVTGEIRDMVARNIPNCSIDDIEIYETDEGLALVAKIKYTVTSNGASVSDEIITNL